MFVLLFLLGIYFWTLPSKKFFFFFLLHFFFFFFPRTFKTLVEEEPWNTFIEEFCECFYEVFRTPSEADRETGKKKKIFFFFFRHFFFSDESSLEILQMSLPSLISFFKVKKKKKNFAEKIFFFRNKKLIFP